MLNVLLILLSGASFFSASLSYGNGLKEGKDLARYFFPIGSRNLIRPYPQWSQALGKEELDRGWKAYNQFCSSQSNLLLVDRLPYLAVAQEHFINSFRYGEIRAIYGLNTVINSEHNHRSNASSRSSESYFAEWYLAAVQSGNFVSIPQKLRDPETYSNNFRHYDLVMKYAHAVSVADLNSVLKEPSEDYGEDYGLSVAIHWSEAAQIWISKNQAVIQQRVNLLDHEIASVTQSGARDQAKIRSLMTLIKLVDQLPNEIYEELDRKENIRSIIKSWSFGGEATRIALQHAMDRASRTNQRLHAEILDPLEAEFLAQSFLNEKLFFQQMQEIQARSPKFSW